MKNFGHYFFFLLEILVIYVNTSSQIHIYLCVCAPVSRQHIIYIYDMYYILYIRLLEFYSSLMVYSILFL